MKRRLWMIIGVVTVALLVLTSCGVASFNDSDEREIGKILLSGNPGAQEGHIGEILSRTGGANTTAVENSTDIVYIGLERAKEIVFAELGVAESQLRDVDYDIERGVYEIDFTYNGMEYEYRVDAVTGRILNSRSEPDDDIRGNTSVETTPAPSEYIGLERAKEIVFAELGVAESQLRDVDYDIERGVYEIDFTYNGMEYEYRVDAVTGRILNSRSEPDDDIRGNTSVETTPAPSEYIGLERAKEIVFTELGVAESQLRDVDYDIERGVYEIDFTYNGMEYEYEVDGTTGRILRAEVERDD